MSWLKDGSDKVCAAPEVQAQMRDLLLPKMSELKDGADNDKKNALASVSFSYSGTTLEGFDKATTKATCNTTLEVHGHDKSSKSFGLRYTISPSADQQPTLVIAVQSDDARAYAATLVAAQMPAPDTAGNNLEDMSNLPTEGPMVDTSVINEQWLAGVWISSHVTGVACTTDRATIFQPDHVMHGGLGEGRWALDGGQLHIVAVVGGKPWDVTGNITQGDAISLTLSIGQQNITLRRCSQEELQPPPAPAPAPAPSGQTNGDQGAVR